MRDGTDFEASLVEYFRLVSTRQFAIFFESAIWESIVLQVAFQEQSIYHAILATSAMTRYQDCPTEVWFDPGPAHTSSALEYSLLHYNVAMRSLNARLDGSPDTVRLAILGSIIFIHIEYTQRQQTFAPIHLRGGLALVQSHKTSIHDSGYLESALLQIQKAMKRLEARDKVSR